MRKLTLLFLIFSIHIRTFFGETVMTDLDLSSMPYTWLSVLSGKSLASPVRTSYGWANLTDGKMITAFTESGKVLWQKGLPSQPLPLLSASSGDFVCAALKNKRLCLLNPSGVLLWQKPVGFEVKEPPFFGRDGRIFVFGRERAACFGVNGIQKWSVQTDEADSLLPPSELEDGSFLLFLQERRDGKSVALRLSPFGKVLEKIIFAGDIRASASLETGVVLVFSDGTLGMCSIDRTTGQAVSKWVMKDLCLRGSVLLEPLDSYRIALADAPAQGTRISVVNTKVPAVEDSFSAGGITAPVRLSNSSDGLFISDGTFAEVYSQSGNRIRGVKFPPKAKECNWNYFEYGKKSGTLVFTAKNWTVTGWKILKGEDKKAKAVSRSKKDYNVFYESVSQDHKRVSSAPNVSRKEILEKGGYGDSEREYFFDADFIMKEYFNSKMRQKSYGGNIADLSSSYDDDFFTFDISQETAVISMLHLFGQENAQKILGKILSVEQDETVLIQALKSVQQCGYDPGLSVMSALEQIIKNASPRQGVLLDECCAALYSVCRFMGRPALYKKGLRIISNLFLPQYPSTTKDSARKIYEKLAELDM